MLSARMQRTSNAPVVMGSRRTRKNLRKGRKSGEADGTEAAAADRLRSIGTGNNYTSEERDDVETRIRNMWYGARKESNRTDSD